MNKIKSKLILLIMPIISIQYGSAQLYISDNNYVFNKGELFFVKENIEMNGSNSYFNLRDQGQLLQGTTGSSANKGEGKLSVFQEGTVNEFAYNYWCSPVGNTSTAVGNENFGITMIKQPTGLITFNDIVPTSSYNGSTTSTSLNIAKYWIWKYPKMGKLESVHYLTPHGVFVLQDYFGEDYSIRFPKGNNGLFQQDYFHRINTINVHIAFNSWAIMSGVDLLFFRTYFDKLSSGKEKGYRAESAILIQGNEYLIADALCLLQSSRREELYAIEMYNGDDTKRVHGSLFAHLQALKNGQPSKQFGLNYGSRVLCIFEKESYKIQAMKRVMEDDRFASDKSHFLFKSLEDLSVDSFFDWWFFDGTKGSLY